MKQDPHEAGRLAVQWGRQELCSGDVLLGLVRLGPLNPPVSELKGLLCPQPWVLGCMEVSCSQDFQGYIALPLDLSPL